MPPSAVDAMPAKDMADLRWLYSVCPFGPLRGDMQAWLAGTQAKYGTKGFTLEQAMGVFQSKSQKPSRARRRAEPKTKRPSPSALAEKIKGMSFFAGAIPADKVI